MVWTLGTVAAKTFVHYVSLSCIEGSRGQKGWLLMSPTIRISGPSMESLMAGK